MQNRIVDAGFGFYACGFSHDEYKLAFNPRTERIANARKRLLTSSKAHRRKTTTQEMNLR